MVALKLIASAAKLVPCMSEKRYRADLHCPSLSLVANIAKRVHIHYYDGIRSLKTMIRMVFWDLSPLL